MSSLCAGGGRAGPRWWCERTGRFARARSAHVANFLLSSIVEDTPSPVHFHMQSGKSIFAQMSNIDMALRVRKLRAEFIHYLLVLRHQSVRPEHTHTVLRHFLLLIKTYHSQGRPAPGFVCTRQKPIKALTNLTSTCGVCSDRRVFVCSVPAMFAAIERSADG